MALQAGQPTLLLVICVLSEALCVSRALSVNYVVERRARRGTQRAAEKAAMVLQSSAESLYVLQL